MFRFGGSFLVFLFVSFFVCYFFILDGLEIEVIGEGLEFIRL